MSLDASDRPCWAPHVEGSGKGEGRVLRAHGVYLAPAMSFSLALSPPACCALRRYIYELYYKEGKISQELYDFLARHKVIDTALISKWRQSGYEILCSMSAINKNSTNFGTAAICRVPLAQRTGHIAPSVLTGCVSCASGDGINGGPVWWTDPYTVWAAKKRKGGPGDSGRAQAGPSSTTARGGAGTSAADDALDEPTEVEDPAVAKRLKALREEPEDPEVAARLRALRGEP